MSFEDVKYQVAVGNRVLANIGLASGVLVSLGHVSMRVPEASDRFVVKGRRYKMDALPRMRPEDMVVCDFEGNLVEGPPGAMQCHEVKIHSCIYRDRPEVQSIVHVHPRFTVLASTLGTQLKPMCQEGALLVRDPVPVYPHFKMVTDDGEGTLLASLLGDSKVILMTGHGAVSIGSTVDDAIANMYQLEEQAKMNWYGMCAVGPDYPGIPTELLNEARDAPPIWELPHLREHMKGTGATTGQMVYHRTVAEESLAAEGITKPTS
jgi:ribulose-5-phosphate 4-epimerase/fuculose-1-phosphate aldolase